MMKALMNAVERLRRRFDVNAQKQEETKAAHASAAKRPPKRQRRR